MLLFSKMPVAFLKILLGIFMILVAIRGIYVSFIKSKKVIKVPGFLLNILLFLGGIIHGAFGSGGPFIVIYATKNLPKKSSFRATLCALWFTLNTIIIIEDLITSAITFSVLKLLLISLPFLIAGMVIGNVAHGKLKEDLFTKLIYIVLFFSGVFMFF